MSEQATMEKVERITPTIARAVLKDLTIEYGDVRYAVDAYYQLQRNRIAGAGQARSAESDAESHFLADYLESQSFVQERSLKNFLGEWAKQLEAGRWAMRQYGIGPVIAAGLLAHIDIEKAPTVGHIWRFAGLDPTVQWSKGQKRPWNARLKVICWKAGESFKKFSNREDCFYGHLYRQRKELEVSRNEAGAFADQAAATLAAKKFGDNDTRAAYEAGKLPAGRLDLRATRWAVKIFLAHLHEVMYLDRYKTMPPKPYVLEHGGHAHRIVRPD